MLLKQPIFWMNGEVIWQASHLLFLNKELHGLVFWNNTKGSRRGITNEGQQQSRRLKGLAHSISPKQICLFSKLARPGRHRFEPIPYSMIEWDSSD